MSKVTCNLPISADVYSAGHNQTEKWLLARKLSESEGRSKGQEGKS